MKKVFKFLGRMIKKFFIGIVKMFVLVYRQMKKMRWPSKEIIISSTALVLVFMFFMGLYFTFSDFVIVNLLRLIKY